MIMILITIGKLHPAQSPKLSSINVKALHSFLSANRLLKPRFLRLWTPSKPPRNFLHPRYILNIDPHSRQSRWFPYRPPHNPLDIFLCHVINLCTHCGRIFSFTIREYLPSNILKQYQCDSWSIGRLVIPSDD